MTPIGKPLPDSCETRWHILPDMHALATAASKRILESARQAISERGMFQIVLAGGTTPEAVYLLLANADSDWSCWQIYFGDERCLPAGHAERNSTMVSACWLDRVALPAANIHPINAESGAEAAAQAYAPVIEQARPFDMVLLGVGEDGHTASLFPGQQHPADQLVHAVHNAPKPPPDRVSLSAGALNEAREVLILVTGAGKQAAIRGWRAGEQLPIAGIGGSAQVDVLLDKAAQA